MGRFYIPKYLPAGSDRAGPESPQAAARASPTYGLLHPIPKKAGSVPAQTLNPISQHKQPPVFNLDDAGFYTQRHFMAICYRAAMLLLMQLFYSAKGKNKR